MDDVTIRPMLPADVPIAEQISAEAFHRVALDRLPRSAPDPIRRTPARSARWIARTESFLRTDAGGCWVAVLDGGIVGFATSIRRERLWVLATFATRPDLQGRGIGRRLLDAALTYGDDCDHALLAASDDPAALRRYHLAGFTLHPQLTFTGRPDLSALPRADGLRAGAADDLVWIDDLDRRLRGGPHGPDHAALAAMAPLVVDTGRRGYAYATDGELFVLGARDQETAARLLAGVLCRAAGEFSVSHVTVANQWAVDVALAARLTQGTQGYLGVRGLEPPSPYVHNGALL